MFHGKYWISPKPKKWYELVVDGKIVGCCEDSAANQKDIQRLSHLKGIEIRPASNETHIRFRTRTEIPNRILKVMERKAIEVPIDVYGGVKLGASQHKKSIL